MGEPAKKLPESSLPKGIKKIENVNPDADQLIKGKFQHKQFYPAPLSLDEALGNLKKGEFLYFLKKGFSYKESNCSMFRNPGTSTLCKGTPKYTAGDMADLYIKE